MTHDWRVQVHGNSARRLRRMFERLVREGKRGRKATLTVVALAQLSRLTDMHDRGWC